jgi:hypothetical protein
VRTHPGVRRSPQSTSVSPPPPIPHHAPADPFLPVDLKLPEELAADAPMPISPGDVLVALHYAHRAGGLGSTEQG